MACPILTFNLSLNSNHWRLDVTNNLSKSFFQDICKPTSCLHHLIPPPWDTTVTTRLILTISLPRPNLLTKKYCSFTNFGLYTITKQHSDSWHTLHISPSTYAHICTLSVSFAVFSIILTALSFVWLTEPEFQGHCYLQVEYLRNGASEGQSYYRTLIWNHTQSIEWYQFQWPLLTHDPDFKVLIFFDIEYLRNVTR